MKHYNDFLIVGIDHGYGNIKTANTVTPTGITKLDAAAVVEKLNEMTGLSMIADIGNGSGEKCFRADQQVSKTFLHRQNGRRYFVG